MSTPLRRIPFQGTPNFRDLGGYTTNDGRQIAWRKFFRSGQLSHLSDADVDRFADLGIEAVVDFRRVEENERDPSRFPLSKPPRLFSLTIDPGSTSSFFDNMAHAHEGSASYDMAEFMCLINSAFALEHHVQYRGMLDAIEDLGEGGLLFHCAAGKDRTGFAAALIMMILDVSREQIMQDYLLTAEYFFPDKEVSRLAKKYADSEFGKLDAEMLKPMLEVRPEYLQHAFDAIDENYTDTADYLRQVFGISKKERSAWQQRFLVE